MDFSKLNVDELDSLTSYTVLDAGIYNAIIKKSEVTVSKSGKDMIILTLEITHNNGKVTIKDNLILSSDTNRPPYGIIKITQIVKSWGLDIKNIPNYNNIVLSNKGLNDLLGAFRSLSLHSDVNSQAISKLMVSVNIEKSLYEGTERNNIKSYIMFQGEVSIPDNEEIPF